MLCDADDVVEPDWLASYWEAFCSGAQCMSGALLLIDSGGREVARQIPPFQLAATAPPHAVGANCAFDVAVHEAVGGFDEALRGGSDETDFYWRAFQHGFDVVPVPNAVVRYRLRAGILAAFVQGVTYGRGHARLLRKHAEQVVMPETTSLALLRASLGSIARIIFRRGYARHRSAKRLGFTIGASLENRK